MAAFLSKEVRIVIIYISREENRQMLDPLAEQYEWELLTEAVDKISLTTFISNKLQLITNLQYMVIDRSCISETDKKLNEMMKTVHEMWETNVILLTEELADEEDRQQKVIYSEQITFLYKYQDNLAGKLEYLLKGERIPEKELYESVWIGIMSANSGAGATHVSIGLANYIGRQGESVCYVEANESGDLNAMAAFYGMEQAGENHYQKDGVDYWHQSIDSDKRFAVLDLGKYSGMKSELFNQCKIKILVTDGKPYRMADALTVLRYINDETAKLWLNFSYPEEYERVRDRYLDAVKNETGRIEWHRDMFRNEDILYGETMKEYIPIHPVRQSRISILLNPVKLKGRKKDFFGNTMTSNNRQEEENLSSSSLEMTAYPVKEENMELSEIPELSDDSFEMVVHPEAEESAEELESSYASAGYPEKPEYQEEENEEEPGNPEQESMALMPEETDIQEEEPEPDWEVNVEPDEGSNPAEPEETDREEKTEKKRKKGLPAGMLVLFLIVCASILFTKSFVPSIKQLASGFLFNNPDTEQTTELVDDDLNINPDIKISVLEVEGADGYEVSYSTDKDFDRKTTVVVEVETADKAVESLTAGKTYYVRVRAFKFNEDGTKVYGEYTEVQKIET